MRLNSSLNSPSLLAFPFSKQSKILRRPRGGPKMGNIHPWDFINV